MSDRPTCCERARETEALAWWTEADWQCEGAQDTRPGWRIVSGFVWGDRSKTEPEYARADFCPFCGGNPGRVAGVGEDLRILLNSARALLRAHGQDPNQWCPMVVSAGLRDLADEKTAEKIRSITTASQAVETFGPERRDPSGFPQNLTAEVIDALRGHR